MTVDFSWCPWRQQSTSETTHIKPVDGQYYLIYNDFSFRFAALAAATLFFWLGRSQVAVQYKTAMTITGLVTFIAAYHYFRIFES